jgi:UDP-2,3-diacylglucosamine hydrolase
LTTLFISDLHLSGERPAIIRLFLEFLRAEASRASALYILGDLFEYWLGDEAVEEPAVRSLIEGLSALTGSGVPVHVMHGNRDFLLGERFARTTGCHLLAEPAVIEPGWVRQFLSKTVPERLMVVQELRALSQHAMSTKSMEIMDVNQRAVENAMRQAAVRRLIHGHTHRPGTHEFTLDGTPAQRIVLGDWYEQGSVLECHAEDCKLRRLPV